MDQLQIKVEQDWMGFYAYDEKQGLDFSCENGEDWTSCGSPIGSGSTIQEAIENVYDLLWEREAKRNPEDKRFDDLNFQLPYSWA